MTRKGMIAAGLASLVTGAPLVAQEVTEVRFAPGNFGTMIEGDIQGSDYVDYTLGAAEGQRLFADLDVTSSTGSGIVYFNVMPPGADWQVLHVGSRDGNLADLVLPEDGTYTIRVYQMGNDADTGAVSDFTIDLSIQ